MNNKPTSTQTKSARSSRILFEKSYEQEMAESIHAKNVAEAARRGMPLWILEGFPAVSNEPDQDDPIDE